MMVNWKEYKFHEPNIIGKRKKVDNNIYTFDIESTSYLILDGIQKAGCEYEDLTEEEQEKCKKCSCMYIWQFSINDIVYYGRTWNEFKEFIKKVDENVPELKILFIHELPFEFQYLKSYFDFSLVFARSMHKPLKAIFQDLNFELRCTRQMTNSKLEYLPKLYNLPVEKKTGDLDYTKIRHSQTPLTVKEMGYCEYDCLVLYYYILEELKKYERVDRIPITSTGHVRRELKELVEHDWKYKSKVYKAINTDVNIYNLLIEAFAGGYTHANYCYSNEILEDVDSWDFCSSYPYTLTTHKFPMTEFKKCKIEKREQMLSNLAYLLVVKFKGIKCKFYNNFISNSKCRKIVNAKYDNGRIISADEIEIVLTDVDFYFILDSYNCKSYEIQEAYFSQYGYLPKQFIEFILEKYVDKTKFKNVEGKEVDYNIVKQLFNALYGMTVTNNIRDNVLYYNETGLWDEDELTNEQIIDALEKEKKKCFLSFAWGVWTTAFARNNLLRNIITGNMDDYVVYCDTDSLKILNGYDKNIIYEYNKFVENKIKYVSEQLEIPIEKFKPKDIKGIEHMLGIFEIDGHYEKFITQGAKKYAHLKYVKNNKIDKKYMNVVEKGETESLVLQITVAGVPKQGCYAINDLSEFKDDLIFENKFTNKNLRFYCENQEPFELVDYLGNKYTVTDVSGVCLVPTTYKMKRAKMYASLVDSVTKRAKYKL